VVVLIGKTTLVLSILCVTNLTQGKLRGSDWPEVQIMCGTTSISMFV